ncbi:MAG TPA: MarR family transcriptional regulator [Thermoanaerobaculia bacterium]|jgi:DNA-binding MarR family transcriptional regulator|nr:MarR family transcriptional regulator [Thermoanaerobaculia bacterium]
MKRRKLDDGHSVLNSFRCIVKSLRQADRASVREHGLGAAQLYVLHELRRESPLSISELAERTATDQSTVSVVVAKLIEKEFVARERSETDARRLDLTLTAKGLRAVKSLPPPIQHSLVEAVGRLPGARAAAVAEGLREIVRILGIEDEYPPMLLAEEEKPKRKSRP